MSTERLPFYKPPQQKPNQYQFSKKDIEANPVVQRFQKRPPPPSNNSQVSEGGRASQAGIKLGDTIVKINGEDTKAMALAEAHQKIQAAGEDLNLSVKNFEEEEAKNKQATQEINFRAEKSAGVDRSNWIQQPERKVWHPIVWQQPPPPVLAEDAGKDSRHKRIINNIYRFFRETENNPEFRQKHVEDMLLALPTASKNY